MDIVETHSEGLTRGFKITVGAAELSERQEQRLSDIGQSAQIAGFRPGKVPLSILKQRFGRAVLGEVLEAAVQEATQKTLEERGLRPATQPTVNAEEFKEDEDFEYELNVEILPDIEPDDFSTYSLERLKVAPSDADIDAALDQIASQRRDTKPVTEPRAAKSGDIVVLDFEGRIDGEAFAGGAAEGHVLELGSGQFIPGFEDQIEGQKPGQEFDVSVSFPADYQAEDLAGKNAVFSCKLNEIREISEVTIDDEFAKSLGLDGLEALRRQAATQIEQEYARMARDRLKRRLLDILADNHTFEVPPSMLESEFKSIWDQIEAAREKGELEEEDAAKPEDELKAEYTDIALRRVRLGLLLSEIGQRNDISVSAEEANRALMQFARQFPGQEQEVVARYQESPQALQEIQAPIFEDKVVDYMLEMAKVTERSATRDELYASDDDDVSAETKKAPAKAKKPASKAKKPASSAKSGAKSSAAKSAATKKKTGAAKKKS